MNEWMLFPDYSKGESLAHDWIIEPGLRVSTVSFPSKSGRTDSLIETWIFSEIPGQRSIQIFHKTREKASKVHRYIVNNLKIIHKGVENETV